MTTDLNTLLTALYVKIDDWLGRPPRTGRPAKLSDAELLTLAVAQALLGIRSEARWLRFVPGHRLQGGVRLFKEAEPDDGLARLSAADRGRPPNAPSWPDGPATATATATARRTPGSSGDYACIWSARQPGCRSPGPLATPKLDERQVLTAVLDHDPDLMAERPGLLIVADKGYVSAESDRWLAERRVRLLRPSYRNRTPHPDEHLLKPIRQLIESVNDTLKGQLDLEPHGGRSIEGVATRIAQRLLAETAAIWHNHATGQPVTRSLIAYDH